MLPGNHGNDFRIELVWSFKFKTILMHETFFWGGGADVVCLIIMLYNRQYLKEVSVQY